MVTTEKTQTILLVEDEATLALVHGRLLEREGYKVIHASTGEQAVEIAVNQNGGIDLVLMDIDLGAGIDGTEAAQRILAACSVPLAFLSSHTEKEYTERAEQISSYGYIVKNSGNTVLLASIKMAFRLFEANKNLRRREQQFRLMAEHARDLIYQFELVPERRFRYVSPSAYLITGYTPEDHYADPELGMKLVHPSDKEHLLNLMESGRALSEPLVLRWFRKDGRMIWTEQNMVPVYDNEGNLVAIEGIARDITERKKLQESLLESNERLAAFLAISKELSAASDTDRLLRLIVDSTAEVTGLISDLAELEADGRMLCLSATTPPLPDDFPKSLRTGPLRDHPHIKRAVETGESILIEDTSRAVLSAAEKDMVHTRNLKSILLLPIRYYNAPLGVLIVASVGEAHHFSNEEVKLLEGFADHAGQVIHRLRNS